MYIEVYTMFILRQLKVNSQVDLAWDELKHPVINLRTWPIIEAKSIFLSSRSAARGVDV